MRVLRNFVYKASIEHWCDYCLKYIYPGEFYEGSVQIIENHLIVFKKHIDGCDFPEDDGLCFKSKHKSETCSKIAA